MRKIYACAFCFSFHFHDSLIVFSLFFLSKMVSISESIDDMVAYSQLTDHVFYQILYSTDPGLEEVMPCVPDVLAFYQ